MSFSSERMRSVIARAAPPHERLGGAFEPEPVQDRARLERLTKQWRDASGEEAGEAALASVRLTGAPPPWGAAFLELAAGDDLFAAPRRFIAEIDFPTTDDARASLLRHFGERVNAIVSPLLEFEAQLASSNAMLGAGAEVSWPERFERFPVLAYLLGTAFLQWQDALRELFARLSSDMAVLFAGEDPGALSAFRGDAGDVHGGGRSVALLTFESGRRIVYKPKDLRCAAALNEFIARLNEAGLDPPLRTRGIVVRGDYAWEEHIAHLPCASREEVAQFYRRFGMLVRLLQLVEGRDFWLDNLIAEGAQPVFIDLEMILQPRVVMTLAPAELEARRRLGETVAEICAVAMVTPIGVGMSSVDFGALAKPGEYLTPYKRGAGYATWSHHEHAPMLDGVAADGADYFDALTGGYVAMQEILATLGQDLLADGSPLLRLRDAPVRFIRRDTWTYYKLLRRSYAPPLLVDGVQREIFLRRLLRHPVGEESAAHRAAEEHALSSGEIVALRQLDVPLFTSVPSTRDVRTPADTLVRDTFDGAAWDRLVCRVETIREYPLEDEIELLRACFATVHPVRPRPRVRASGDRWLEEALAIGDAILRDTTEKDGELAAIGIVCHPHIDLLALDVLQADLLTGTCGLALLFADLYAATGERRFETAARRALASIGRAMNESRAQWPELGAGGLPLYCGALIGAGAQIFTLRACASLLADSSIADAAEVHAASIPLEAALARCGTGFVSGATGLLLALEGDRAHSLAALLASRKPFLLPAFPQQRIRFDDVPDADAAFALGMATLGDPSQPFDSGVPGNLRVALELERHRGAAIDRARHVSSPRIAALELSTEVFALTGEGRDLERATRIARECLSEEPLRYDFSAIGGRVALARALVQLARPGERLASVRTLRLPAARSASVAVSGDCT